MPKQRGRGPGPPPSPGLQGTVGGAAASARPFVIFFPTDRSPRPADGPPPPCGGDRLRWWAPEAVSAGSRGTPQTATRGTLPGTPGGARGGPASPPTLPPRRGGEAGRAGRRTSAAGPGGGGSGSCCRRSGVVWPWSWGDEGSGATLRRPQPRPGKSPGRLTIERPSDRRSPGRNPGPQGAF
ncbi:hypothetical protein NDU88_006656 [Pleurodeles waltl]|uniref:Uncharacterized protein n=1 Tax=Pleurodeles waltl TaxID=8319 RepID=A0AAV7QMK5_PLEWA|nr:hypothetical protein NDU88_006656 [Pleurodeles waltl]